tara:strand:+ start:62 stop:433 length:372 start_codon:yes stop_codon:yes gene_type:complete
MTITSELQAMLAEVSTIYKDDYLPIKAMISLIHDIQLDVFSEGCLAYAEATFSETKMITMCEMVRECADHVLVKLIAGVELAKSSGYEIDLWLGEDNAVMLDRSLHIRNLVRKKKADEGSLLQ